MGISQRRTRKQGRLLSVIGLGESDSSRVRSLLSRTTAGLLPQSSSLFQWPGAHRDLTHWRSRHPHDHGVVESTGGFAAVLHLRWFLPRLSGCNHSATSRQDLWAALSSN